MNKQEIYIESQANNLVRTGHRFSVQIYDYYGNKTNHIDINNDQFNEILETLKH